MNDRNVILSATALAIIIAISFAAQASADYSFTLDSGTQWDENLLATDGTVIDIDAGTLSLRWVEPFESLDWDGETDDWEANGYVWTDNALSSQIAIRKNVVGTPKKISFKWWNSDLSADWLKIEFWTDTPGSWATLRNVNGDDNLTANGTEVLATASDSTWYTWSVENIDYSGETFDVTVGGSTQQGISFDTSGTLDRLYIYDEGYQTDEERVDNFLLFSQSGTYSSKIWDTGASSKQSIDSVNITSSVTTGENLYGCLGVDTDDDGTIDDNTGWVDIEGVSTWTPTLDNGYRYQMSFKMEADDDTHSPSIQSATLNVSKAGPNESPTADFTYTISGATVEVDASSSTDPDGTISSYQWDWNGDGTYDSTGQTASHTYSEDGRYELTLKVTDDSGGTDTTSEIVYPNPSGAGGLVSELWNSSTKAWTDTFGYYFYMFLSGLLMIGAYVKTESPGPTILVGMLCGIAFGELVGSWVVTTMTIALGLIAAALIYGVFKSGRSNF